MVTVGVGDDDDVDDDDKDDDDDDEDTLPGSMARVRDAVRGEEAACKR